MPRMRPAARFDAAHARLRREGHELRADLGKVAAANAVFLLGEHDDRAALRRFVGKRGELGGIGKFGRGHAAHRFEFGRLAIAERDRAGLVEQQRIDVARRFHSTARDGEHVEAHEPIHARDADRRQQRTDRCRDQRHEQSGKHDDRDGAARIGDVARDRRRGDQEDDRQTDEQNGQGDFVGRLLALRPFDKLDHAVDERVAGFGRDAHAQPVRNHLRAAGDRRAVAAGFADHRCGLARDGGFVDGGDTLDNFAVGRNEIAGFDEHDVAGFKLACGHFLVRPARRMHDALSPSLAAQLAQRVGLRLAAAFRDRFGEIREQHGEPQPDDDLEHEADIGPAGRDVLRKDGCRKRRHDGQHEDDGILRKQSRIELGEGGTCRGQKDTWIDQRRTCAIGADRGVFHCIHSETEPIRKACRRPS